MKKYAKNIDNRKVLVERLVELTGKEARYTFVPRCAYEVGEFTVEKDGSLTVQDGADETVIQILKDEDMIGEEMVEEAPPVGVTMIHASQADEAEANTTTNLREQEAEDWVSDVEYEQEAEAESAVSLGVTDANDSAEEADAPTSDGGGEPAFPMDAVICFPLRNHSVTTLTNLISLIYTRGPLLSKATGGVFLADKELVDAILDEYTLRTVDELREVIRDYEAQHGEAFLGFHIGEDKVIFDGFTEVPDDKHLQTYTRLAAAMNKMSLNQKRVQAKEVDQTNEKYALRIWLIRLGMNGVEYKADRKILMEKLSGHTAFRTEEEKERAKEKAIRKRDALRAIKAQAAEDAAAAE